MCSGIGARAQSWQTGAALNLSRLVVAVFAHNVIVRFLYARSRLYVTRNGILFVESCGKV